MTTVDPLSGRALVSPRRWSVLPVPAGFSLILLAIFAAQLHVTAELPWPASGWALMGAAMSFTSAAMFTAGWWWHSSDWTRRGYFLAGSVFLARGLAVFAADGALIDVAIMGGLTVAAACSWRAEVEARWQSQRKS